LRGRRIQVATAAGYHAAVPRRTLWLALLAGGCGGGTPVSSSDGAADLGVPDAAAADGPSRLFLTVDEHRRRR
jgi:hypothetical protein